jgi:type VI protein secretion system component VasA
MRLQLAPEGSPDPHVERLIESFAYLSARVQRSIDGEFPQLTAALFGLLHPQLAAPRCRPWRSPVSGPRHPRQPASYCPGA